MCSRFSDAVSQKSDFTPYGHHWDYPQALEFDYIILQGLHKNCSEECDVNCYDKFFLH